MVMLLVCKLVMTWDLQVHKTVVDVCVCDVLMVVKRAIELVVDEVGLRNGHRRAYGIGKLQWKSDESRVTKGTASVMK